MGVGRGAQSYGAGEMEMDAKSKLHGGSFDR